MAKEKWNWKFWSEFVFASPRLLEPSASAPLIRIVAIKKTGKCRYWGYVQSTVCPSVCSWFDSRVGVFGYNCLLRGYSRLPARGVRLVLPVNIPPHAVASRLPLMMVVTRSMCWTSVLFQKYADMRHTYDLRRLCSKAFKMRK